MLIKDDQLIFRCLECKKNYTKDFNRELIKRFANTYELCKRDVDKFILLLRKRVYPYQYMNSWERFYEELLLDKEAFYSSLNMKVVKDIDYRHARKVFKNLHNKNLSDYLELYMQINTLF